MTTKGTITLSDFVDGIRFIYGPEMAKEFLLAVEEEANSNKDWIFDSHSSHIQELYRRLKEKNLKKQFENVDLLLGLKTNSYSIVTEFDEE